MKLMVKKVKEDENGDYLVALRVGNIVGFPMFAVSRLEYNNLKESVKALNSAISIRNGVDISELT